LECVVHAAGNPTAAKANHAQALTVAARLAEPVLVAECIAAMRASVGVPVTVKTRIGIDERDSYEYLHDFVTTVAAAGCGIFVVHARKAWLKGLSPKENREIPPLRYEVAAQVKRDFPDLRIVLNGGVKKLDDAAAQLDIFDGVMIGREAYQNPWILAHIRDRQHLRCGP
jgi:tRNA-dihydrouridine synthase A